MIKLLYVKNCPFCGKTPLLDFSLGKLSISCVNKKCHIKPSTWLRLQEKNVEKLIHKWNRREGD